ncbi:transferrin-binding protein-like solute binding protein [Vreelandella alkaliphila]|uniref:transferrin-binding protein-like solute binding protein n=1 Tax=Vreelandella alkaliphila TaxID=272774 RepID=UPI003FD78519
METIDNKGSVLRLSLLALAIVAVAGCSSGGSSSQPIDQGDPGQTDGGGGSSDSGGSSGDSGGGSGDGGGSSDPGQDFTYKTINPIEEIPVGEEFRLDSVTANATPSSSGVTMNQQPVLDHAAMIEVLPNGPNGESRIRLNAPIAGVENRDFTEGRAPYIFDNGEDNDIRIRSVEHESEQFLNGSLNYAAFGEWVIRNSGGDSDASYFATGYDTHLNDMPSTGSASYSGAARGIVIIDNGQPSNLFGQANMSVNFADRTLNGSLTNMTAMDTENGAIQQPWNNINLAGGLDDSGNRFAGITEVISSPGNTASLSTDAEGEFRGRFYGPGAAEAAAVWSVKDPNGSAAFGAFGVKKD